MWDQPSNPVSGFNSRAVKASSPASFSSSTVLAASIAGCATPDDGAHAFSTIFASSSLIARISAAFSRRLASASVV